jgi:glycosyltransferase involved in cell wall biosynthesis
MTNLTIQILTKNNEKTIKNSLTSAKNTGAKLFLADLGSTDKTTEICEKNGVPFERFIDLPHDQVRNILAEKSKTKWQMRLDPWETIIRGYKELNNLTEPAYYCSIIENGKSLRKEIRIWDKERIKHTNPVFEMINYKTESELNLVLSSSGHFDFNYIKSCLEKWKNSKPFISQPVYYESCILLSEGNYEEFLKRSEHYMILDNSRSMSSVMNHYYYALVQVIYKKNTKKAMQNINLCLSEKPLMAEFWCLQGDICYHLLREFKKAKIFFENAILLGSRRLKSDKWPLEIEKYKEYPEKMIKSCDSILNEKGYYGA